MFKVHRWQLVGVIFGALTLGAGLLGVALGIQPERAVFGPFGAPNKGAVVGGLISLAVSLWGIWDQNRIAPDERVS